VVEVRAQRASKPPHVGGGAYVINANPYVERPMAAIRSQTTLVDGVLGSIESVWPLVGDALIAHGVEALRSTSSLHASPAQDLPGRRGDAAPPAGRSASVGVKFGATTAASHRPL
jgi:hypothetical protein